MNEKYILIVLVILIIVIIFVVLILILRNNNKTVVVTKISNKEQVSYKKNLTIKDMSEIAAKRKSSHEELKKAIDCVKKNMLFPKKTNHKLPKDIKIYLNFVLLVASHKNADASLIAYMDRELKKVNPQYNTEIDIYENEGLKERVNRI